MNIPEMTIRIDGLTKGFMHSQVLFTAMRVDLFSLLTGGETAEGVAKALQWSPRGARLLLDGLVALELVEQSGGRYTNAPIAAACLVPGGPAYQGNIVRHIQSSWDAWTHLEDAVASGTSAGADSRQRSPEDLRNFILGMADIARFSAQEMLDTVDLSGCRKMLDVGGGPAAYSIAFVQRYPEARATLFDLPDVIPLAREQAAAASVEDRVDFRPGDYLVDSLGEGYDFVLVSNIIHSLGPDANRVLIEKCRNALEPGGLLIIKDFIVDPDRTGPAFSLLFALHMLVNTPEGDTYTQDNIEQWASGFTHVRTLDLARNSRLWIARRT